MTQNQSPLAGPEPWELVAEGYAAEAPHLMRGFSMRALGLVQPAADARVLDVAAGPGTLSLELAARVARVDAIDFSPNMVALLESERKRLALDNLFARVGDGQALPFDSASFDAAFSLFGLMFFPDRPKGYAELLRVLKPSATALVSSWAPAEDSSLMRALFGAIAEMDPDFVAPRRNIGGLENPEVLAAELSAAGFVDVHVHAVSQSMPVISPAELWERFQRANAPLVLLRRRLGEAAWAERTPAAVRRLGREVGEQRELASSAWLATGRCPG